MPLLRARLQARGSLKYTEPWSAAAAWKKLRFTGIAISAVPSLTRMVGS
jgi:hypothetical protein